MLSYNISQHLPLIKHRSFPHGNEPLRLRYATSTAPPQLFKQMSKRPADGITITV